MELSSPPTNAGNLNPPTPPSPDPLPVSATLEKDERLVGYALYFFNYSTWQGRVLYLEDLYIRAEYRSKLHV